MADQTSAATTQRLELYDLDRAYVSLKWTTSGAAAHVEPQFIVKVGGSGALLDILHFAEFKAAYKLAVERSVNGSRSTPEGGE